MNRDAPTAHPAGGRRRRRWFVVAVVALIAAAGVLAATAHLARDAALDALRERGAADLRLYIANVRRELEKYEYLPALLADDGRLQRLLDEPSDFASWQAVNRYLQLAAQTSNAAEIYLLDREGTTVAASNFDDMDSFIGDNYRFRPYFQQAVQGELGRFYALGITSNERGYYFASPVRVDGAIAGVIVVKVAITVVERERGGGDREFIVTDPNNVVFLSTRPQWRFRTLAPLTDTQRARLRDTRRYPDRELAPLAVRQRRPVTENATVLTLDDGTSYLRQGMPMFAAGWRVHVLSDTAPVAQQVSRSVVLAAMIIAAAGLAGGIVVQRRLRLRERMRFEHAAMEAAAANEARVRAVIDNTRAGLVTLTGDGHIASFNPTAAALFGRAPASVQGVHLATLFERGDAERLKAKLDTAARESAHPVIEVTARRGDGSHFPVEIAVSPMELAEGRRYLVTMHDVSERKANEQALRRAHDELEQRVAERTEDLVAANRRLTQEIEEHRRTEAELTHTRDELVQAAKLAAIGQLSAGINHEVNQPLTAIRAYADNARLLLERERQNEAQENLSQISALTARMARIVHQLKVFARKSSGTPSPVSLPAVVDAALALLESQLTRGGVAIFRHWDSDPLICLGDMVRLEQVFVNLVGNAVHALADTTGPELHITIRRDDARLVATVRDNGPGIDAADLAHIFDAFYTTKETGQGLGLGLSISARIIEEMGGTVHAGNHRDGGAEFTLTLPAAQSEDGRDE